MASSEQSSLPSVNSEVGAIIGILSNLHDRVSKDLESRHAKPNPPGGFLQDHNSTPTPTLPDPAGGGGVKKKSEEKGTTEAAEQSVRVHPLNQLDHDLIYMQYALNRLKGFEGTFGKTIQELKDDLELILTTHATRKSDQDKEILEDEIRRISQKFLNLKSKIPPVHGTTPGESQDQQRRRTNQSKDLPNMPDKPVFTKHEFFVEFEKNFEHLGINEGKKKCLLCFAVFPENAVIKKRLLLYWWISEGFLKDEKAARDLLQDFEDKEFILPVDKKHREVANSFKMNPLARSAVITLAKRDNFFDFDSEGIPTLDFQECKRACLVYAHKEGSIPDRLDQLALMLAAIDLEAKMSAAVDLAAEQLAKNGGSNPNPEETKQTALKVREAIEASFNLGDEKYNDVRSRMEKTGIQGTPAENEQKAADFKAQIKKLESIGAKGTQAEIDQQAGDVRAEIKKLLNVNPRLKSGSNFKIKSVGIDLSREEIEKKATEIRAGIRKSFNVSEEFARFKFDQYVKNKTGVTLTPEEVQQKVKEIEEIRTEIKTLFNVSEEFPEFKFDWFSKLKAIQVLYLGRWQSTLDDIPHIEIDSNDSEYLKGLRIMKSLKFLSLQGISGLREIPKEISSLTSLEILDLRASYNLDILPDEIGKLRSLTHMDISECFLLDGIPKTVCRLSNLQVLKGFVISDHDRDDGSRKQWCSLNDLKNLKKLRKLSININSGNFEAQKLSVIQEFEGLRGLKVSWGGGSSNKSTQTGSGKPGIITRLFTRIQTMANSQTPVSKLEKLDFQCFPEAKLPSWVFPDKLPSLKNLYIRGGGLSSLGNYKWSTVQVLRLKYLNELETDWIELQRCFPKLEYLEKFRCHKVTLCPCDGTGVWDKSQVKTKMDHFQ